MFSLNVYLFFLLNFPRFYNALLPIQKNCGKQSIEPIIQNSLVNRIIGGTYAVSNSWPWLVSLRFYSGKYYSSHFCAGQYNIFNLRIIKILYFV